MAEAYIGEIKMVGFGFAPPGYLPCDGSLVSIADYDALFNLIGTTYGGDGVTTFALPNLSGRMPVHAGSGAGLAPKILGQSGGSESFTLNANNLPPHSHALNAVNATADRRTPGGNALAVEATAQTAFYSSGAPDVAMNGLSLSASGTGATPQSITPPFQAINFIIAVDGLYPSRD